MNDGIDCTIRPVILSGGGGTRLWPLSHAAAPKQFLPIVEEDSLLQTTARRCQGASFRAPIVVAGEDQRHFVVDQLQSAEVAPEAVLLEPVPRNTAPAIALAALWLLARGEDDLMLVMPSDHLIRDVTAFRQAVSAAAPAAADGAIVTFGIAPNHPHPGYGYIKASSGSGGPVLLVESFIEKPDRETAARLLGQGGYFWNSGMFLMRPSTLMAELEEQGSTIAQAVGASMRGASQEGFFFRPDRQAFTEAPSISIDYAVLERTTLARMLPAGFDWSDIGGWDAVRDALPKDGQGNVLSGDIHAFEVTNSLIRCDTGVPVAIVGLTNIVCVVTDQGVFIAPLDRAHESKQVVDQLRARRADVGDHSGKAITEA